MLALGPLTCPGPVRRRLDPVAGQVDQAEVRLAGDLGRDELLGLPLRQRAAGLGDHGFPQHVPELAVHPVEQCRRRCASPPRRRACHPGCSDGIAAGTSRRPQWTVTSGHARRGHRHDCSAPTRRAVSALHANRIRSSHGPGSADASTVSERPVIGWVQSGWCTTESPVKASSVGIVHSGRGLDGLRPMGVDAGALRRFAAAGGRLADIEVGGAADGLRPVEPVEARQYRLERQPDAEQLLLHLLAQRGRPVAEAVGQQQPSGSGVAQRLDAAAGEQRHAFRRVGRVAEDQIRRFRHGGRQSETEIRVQAADVEAPLPRAGVDVGQHAVVQVDDDHRGGRVDRGHRERGQVVVAEAEDGMAGQFILLVQPIRPPRHRLRRGLHMVERGQRRRHGVHIGTDQGEIRLNDRGNRESLGVRGSGRGPDLVRVTVSHQVTVQRGQQLLDPAPWQGRVAHQLGQRMRAPAQHVDHAPCRPGARSVAGNGRAGLVEWGHNRVSLLVRTCWNGVPLS